MNKNRSSQSGNHNKATHAAILHLSTVKTWTVIKSNRLPVFCHSDSALFTLDVWVLWTCCEGSTWARTVISVSGMRLKVFVSVSSRVDVALTSMFTYNYSAGDLLWNMTVVWKMRNLCMHNSWFLTASIVFCTKEEWLALWMWCLQAAVCLFLWEYEDIQVSQNSKAEVTNVNACSLCVFQVLNEVVVDRGPSSYLSNVDLFLDGHLITTVQGDGEWAHNLSSCWLVDKCNTYSARGQSGLHCTANIQRIQSLRMLTHKSDQCCMLILYGSQALDPVVLIRTDSPNKKICG